ncbi:hypothetical protein ACO0OE_001207 [Hanseniaspora uvarum]
MKTSLNVLIAFLLLQTANAVGQKNFDSKIGCQISSNSEFVSGLTGNVYYYPWLSYNTQKNSGSQNSVLYTTEAYLSGGYIGDGSIITEDHTEYTKPGIIATGVTATELYFRNDKPCSSDGNCNGEVWLELDYFTNSDGSALSVPFKQFAFHMNGYIVPNITGQYTLNLKYIDDLGIMNIGSSGFDSPNCCSNYSPTGDVSGNNTFQSIWNPTGPTGTNQAVLQLVAGVAYPIEFFYVNRGAAGAMQFEYTDPNGDVHQTFDGFVYHLSSEAVCNYVEKHVVTMEWDQSTTSHSSSSSTDILTQTNTYLTGNPITYTGTLIEETEIVYVPIPTVTTYWTGLDTSTSTSYLTTTDTDGSSITSSVIYIRTPEQTTTQLWTGTYTHTTDGSNTVTSPIVIVQTPTSTVTKPWTGTYTSTITTNVVTDTSTTTSECCYPLATDGKDITSTIVVVETPGSTITTPLDWYMDTVHHHL